MLTDKHEPPFFQSIFRFGPNPRIHLSLCRALNFLHLGTPPSKTGEELLYDNLYHE